MQLETNKQSEPFLHKQLKKIVKKEGIYKEYLEKAAKIDSDIYTDERLWSLLKLIFLNYSSSIYTNIINRYYPERYYYIDLFAGSGVGKVTDTGRNELTLGSSLLMATMHKFPKMFFCEKNSKSRIALKNRLNALDVKKDSYEIYSDCNDSIDEIIDKVKGGHSLIFIDPYYTEINWKTMEKVLTLKADIIFNLQSAEIARGFMQQGKITDSAKAFFKDTRFLAQMFQDKTVFDMRKSDMILREYCSAISQTRREIDSKKSFQKKLRYCQ